MKVGCYTLDLYCDASMGPKGPMSEWEHAKRYKPKQYVGRTEAECLRQARKDGWRVGVKHGDNCPICRGCGPAAQGGGGEG